MRERLCCQSQASLGRDRAAAPVNLGEHGAVVERIDDHGNALVVLCRGTHHRGTTDVDILDRVLERAAGPGDRCGERIEIHRDEVDGLDAVLGHHRVVGAEATEQSAVDARVQGLDASVHDLRKAGDGRDIVHLDAIRPQQRGGPAGRDDADTAVAKRAGKFEQAFLARDADECTPDGCVHDRCPGRAQVQAEMP